MEAPGGPWLILCCPSWWLKRAEQCQVAFGEQMNDSLPSLQQSGDSEKSCGGWSIAHSCWLTWCGLTCHWRETRVKHPQGRAFHLLPGARTEQSHPVWSWLRLADPRSPPGHRVSMEDRGSILRVSSKRDDALPHPAGVLSNSAASVRFCFFKSRRQWE